MFGIDDMILGAVISGGISFLGNEMTNEANSAQAAANRDFQANMSGTSYQRAVADMAAAGLNPMLAYSQGGASTPGGSLAQMTNSLGVGVSSAQAGYKLPAEGKILEDTSDKLRQDTDTSAADAELKRSQAALNFATVPKVQQEVLTGQTTARQLAAVSEKLERLNRLDIGGEEWALTKSQAAAAGWESELKKAEVLLGYVPAQIKHLGAQNRALGAQVLHLMNSALHEAYGATSESLGIPRKAVEAKAYDSGNLNIQPYLDAYLGTLGSAVSSAAGGAAGAATASKVFRKVPEPILKIPSRR